MSARATWRFFAVALLALSVPALAAERASAAPNELWTKEVGKTTPGARGVAVAPESAPNRGHIFVSHQAGHQVVEFTAWGELVKVLGWDVVASGPGESAEDKFEICVPGQGDECKAGVLGANVGQFSFPQGISVDSEGAVYVGETITSRRVQKFSPAGEFLLMFGGEVNKGGGSPQSPGNFCTTEHLENGDTCGAGKEGTGPGEFSAPAGIRSEIAITPGDEVWVGDKDRVQRFDAAGLYQGEVSVLGEDINALAIDAAGSLYMAFRIGISDSKEDIRKLDPGTGDEILRFEVVNPKGVAVSPDGDVYVFDKSSKQIFHFDEHGDEVEPPFGDPDFFGDSVGLAASDACGIEGHDVFFGNATPSFLRAYGPPPDPSIEGCEQPGVAPEIAAQYAASVGTDSAAVEAQINPFFWQDATYYVEYGTADCAANPCKRTLFPGAPLTDELTDEPVRGRAMLSGLEPGATYHFRFVVKSGGGGPVLGPDETFTTYRAPEAISCPNQALRSGPSAALPDCRAYEMVSPVDKGGGDADAYLYEGFDASTKFAGLDRSTPAGSQLTFTASTSFAEPEGSPAFPQYMASRGAGGWQTSSIDPPIEGGSANGAATAASQFKAFSEDLCAGWLIPEGSNPLTVEPLFGFRNVYRRANCGASPAFTWLESSGAPPEPCVDPECSDPYLFPDLQGTSADGRCAAFRVNDALPTLPGEAPTAPKGVPSSGTAARTAWQLYVWCEDTGARLASVLPGGAPFAGGDSSAGTPTTAIGFSNGEGHVDTVERALSADGSLLYWTTWMNNAPGVLYLRINADRPQSTTGCEAAKACTLQASPTGSEARFWTASADGTRAIFSSKVVGFDASSISEYTYDPETAKGKATLIAGDSLGVAGASEDATRTYLASEEVCGSDPNSEGDEAVEGEPNLYLHEAGESCAAEELEFVGTLAGEDVSTNAGESFPSPLTANPRYHTARATPDGSHLVFVSAARLTDYDNADASSAQADREVYLYGAEEEELRCVSCNPTGARPTGADLRKLALKGGQPFPLWTAAWIPGYQHQLYGRRLLSEDGSRVYFNSIDSLALRDTNGAQDVYQWEAAGVGTCRAPSGGDPGSATYSEQNGGCVDLISSGKDARDAEFVEASASGDDIFIRTEESLNSEDPGSVDIYDARVEGGFASSGSGQTACEGEGCQSVPPPPPYTAPSSLLFQGPGNQPPLGEDCAAPGRRAAALLKRAKGLRRAAGRIENPARARRMRKQASRLSGRAKAESKKAKRCRQGAKGRAGR